MEHNSCRYVINAVGKGGQTYLTRCQDKHELKKWISDHEDHLVMNELRIIDKKRPSFLKLFSLKR
jgi:demethoxyubiquinone hydroxylase (CLK1/Coq7/Cat5 family)